jgi:hypothetical protein
LLKKGKICKEVLNIHNEIKFITFDESTLALWDKEISNHFQGELHDLNEWYLELRVLQMASKSFVRSPLNTCKAPFESIL